MKYIELEPIEESEKDFEEIEKLLRELFIKEIYKPLMAELAEPVALIKNSNSALEEAIYSGRINFYRGEFTGSFGARISKELGSIGATWDRKQGSWKIPLNKLPANIRSIIYSSEAKFTRVLGSITRRLSEIVPEEIAGKIDFTKAFDKTLWCVEEKFSRQIKNITVAPQLTKAESAKIAEGYNNNMKLYIKNFTSEEIVKLRGKIEKNTYSGVRYEEIINTIRRSYGVSKNKAKFLARQETSLLMANFKQARYESAGSKSYIWKCVNASSEHPVRPMHLRLNNTVQYWNSPPIVNDKGDRKNAGCDFNCRCSARAILRFDK